MSAMNGSKARPIHRFSPMVFGPGAVHVGSRGLTVAHARPPATRLQWPQFPFRIRGFGVFDF
jgi:hypothetical protein